MGAVYAGCFYVLIDTKQPASRLNQILDILKSEVIVTSEKYLKDLEKLGFEGKVLMLSELNAVQEDPIILRDHRKSGSRYRSAVWYFYFRGSTRNAQRCCCGTSFSS